MKSPSLLVKLLIIVCGIFVLAIASMFSIGTSKLTDVIDHSKQAEYEEKLNSMIRMLTQLEERLRRTGMEEAYLQDFQTIALKSLQATFSFSADDPTTPYLIDEQGQLLLPADDRINLPASLVTQLADSRQQTQKSAFDLLGKQKQSWCIYQNFSPWGWTVLYDLPYEVKYSALEEFRTTLLPTVSLLGVFFLALLYVLIKKQLKPIRQLTYASLAMVAGDYKHALPKSSDDEIGTLTESFEKMRQTVSEQLAALQAKEQKFRALLNNQKDAVFLHKILADGYAPFSEVNEAAIERYGYSREEFKQLTVWDITPRQEVEQHLKSRPRKELTAHQQATFEIHHQTKTGERFPVEVNATVMELDGESYILSTVRDIGERKSAEEALRLSNEIFQKLTSSAKDGIIQLNHLGKVVFWNQAATDIFGYENDEIMGADLHQFLAPSQSIEEHQKHFPAFLKTGTANVAGKTVELEAIHKSGDLLTVELSLSAFEINGNMQSMAVVRDITERKRAEKRHQELEAELRQKYKMEAVGVLAGGIAHDFNNILSIILTNLELMRRKIDADNPLLVRVENVRDAAMRASELVRQILDYSRRTPQNLTPVLLSRRLKETVKLLRASIPSSIDIKVQIAPEARDLSVNTNPVQLEEVFLNLCNNAVHAMQEKGILKLTLRKVSLADIHGFEKKSVAADTYLMLQVQDNGCGIPEGKISKIFDPFYTTKPVGSGTGMGLSICHSIIEKSNGFIHVESEPGKGTTFYVYLPISETPVSQVNHAADETNALRGTERLLLVDDEPALGKALQEYLGEMGYQVTFSSDSLEALELIKQNPEDFAVLVTDQTMPGLTGLELSEKVHAINSSLPVILNTGNDSKLTSEKISHAGINAVLRKPVNFALLLQNIRDLLELESGSMDDEGKQTPG